MTPTYNMDDILSDCLFLWGDAPIGEDVPLQYGNLTISVLPKEGKANTLLADHLFPPSLLLAERIERGLLPLHNLAMLELGAGCGLPSLVAACSASPPAIVVLTDYPDELIMSNLEQNVARNRSHFVPQCQVCTRGYEWGTSGHALLNLSPLNAGFDVLVLSDLLHFDASHKELMSCISNFLKKDINARVYLAVANYTRLEVCQAFLALGATSGLWWEEGENDGVWQATSLLSGSDKSDLGRRKAVCRWWTGGWRANGVLNA